MISEGRRILVTGGAGAIGSVASRRLADAGAQVVVNDLLAPGDAAVRIDDGRIHYVQGNGTTADGAATVVAAAEDAVGKLTDVVLLAGIVRTGGLLEQTADDMRATFDTNVLASILTAQASVRRWRENGIPGHLVFISSWVQDVPWPGIAPYAASKAAVRSVARSFAREFAADGIRANILAPGIVQVGMAKHQWDTDPDYQRRARRAVPLGELQSAESVGDALTFLCSPLSAYMTGSTLVVDGGASLYPMDPEEVPDADRH
ncbi:SDR family NAD(P)-dependent oxidoreductase [Kineosporia sp. A_224]|uniref:SDR family NAD(P)-dependent oxidoreductase n=1 Tax=Kineosporia sp. A_224 TaxID=1962180 RepID=UPI000B4A98F0|nr:SDR family oxidoreductase [Kineosporia sp. A_224]